MKPQEIIDSLGKEQIKTEDFVEYLTEFIYERESIQDGLMLDARAITTTKAKLFKTAIEFCGVEFPSFVVNLRHDLDKLKFDLMNAIYIYEVTV